MPLRISKRTSVPPPLTIPKVTKVFESFSTFSIIDTPLLSRRNSNQLNDSKDCTCCGLSLSSFDSTVPLSCGHQWHRSCILNGNTSLETVFCSTCQELSSFLQPSLTDLSETFSTSLSTLLAPPRAFGEPMTPMEQMIPDTLVKTPPVQKDTKKTLFCPLASPGASFSYNKNLYEEVSKPRVSLTNDAEKIIVSHDGTTSTEEIKCLLTVQSPLIHSHEVSDDDSNLKQSVVVEFKSLLLGLQNWHAPSTEAFGDLWLVDEFNVSTDGTSWDPLVCYLFGKCLLLVDTKQHILVGQISLENGLHSMKTTEKTIELGLSAEGTLDLQLNNFHNLVVTKWEYYLIKLRSEQHPIVPLFHLTTNCWQFIHDTRNLLPHDIVSFENYMSTQMDLPESLMVQAIPPPKTLPINLIVSVCLVNCSSKANAEYKHELVSTINSIRSSLRPLDKLGLVVVGVRGPFNSKGSFTGLAEPQWDGWNTILTGLEIIPKQDGKSVIRNGIEELVVSFEKCKSLAPFIPSSPHNINKFLIIQSLNYALNKSDTHAARYLKKLTKVVETFKDMKNLTIDFVRIGCYTEHNQMFYDLLTSPKFRSTYQKSVDVTTGNRMLRYDNFDQFNVAAYVEECQSICIPHVTIELSKITRNFDSSVQFTSVEINGEEFYLNDNMDNVQVTVNNITNKFKRDIMIKVKLDKTKIDNSALADRSGSFGGFLTMDPCWEYPLVTYNTQWLDKHDSKKVMTTKILDKLNDELSQGFFSENGPLTPPTMDEKNFYKDIPLLPPLASSRDQSFTRKQIAMTIIKSLRHISLFANNNLETIQHTITAVQTLTRGLNVEAVDLDKTVPVSVWDITNIKNNHDYCHAILRHLNHLHQLFQADKAQQAVTECHDFANWLI